MHSLSGMKCKGTLYTMHASEDFLTYDLENTSLNKVLSLQQNLKIHKKTQNKTKAKR